MIRHSLASPQYQACTLNLAGFSRADLVGCLSGLSLLALLFLTTAANSAIGSRLAVCLNNHKQLTGAWFAYARDNRGDLDGGNIMTIANAQKTWVIGWLDFSRAPANTNTEFLT